MTVKGLYIFIVVVSFVVFDCFRPNNVWILRSYNVICSKQHTHMHTQPFYGFLEFVTTRISQYQKVHFAIFWIFWSKMKITQADAPAIWMDCHPSRLIGGPTSAIPTVFTQDALPYRKEALLWICGFGKSF